MRHFLLIYDRIAKKLEVDPPQSFDSDQVDAAFATLRAGELREVGSSGTLEVVLVSAPSLQALKESQGSYFLTREELFDRFQSSLAGRRNDLRSARSSRMARTVAEDREPLGRD